MPLLQKTRKVAITPREYLPAYSTNTEKIAKIREEIHVTKYWLLIGIRIQPIANDRMYSLILAGPPASGCKKLLGRPQSIDRCSTDDSLLLLLTQILLKQLCFGLHLLEPGQREDAKHSHLTFPWTML